LLDQFARLLLKFARTSTQAGAGHDALPAPADQHTGHGGGNVANARTIATVHLGRATA
jgi:hypothetical protein